VPKASFSPGFDEQKYPFFGTKFQDSQNCQEDDKLNLFTILTYFAETSRNFKKTLVLVHLNWLGEEVKWENVSTSTYKSFATSTRANKVYDS